MCHQLLWCFLYSTLRLKLYIGSQATIDGMGARITELLASSQTAGEQGNVDAAQAAAAQADQVKVCCSTR